jgi:DNA-binding SARP family transcriptional activator
VALRIHLLGPPRIEHDGELAEGPRGNKAWALLAYLALERRPPSRRKLADLLFSEAADPLGALRWNLAQLRQALGRPEALRGDPVELGLGAGVEIDALSLRSPRLPEIDALERLDGELLEDVSLDASGAFEAWLTVERRRQAAAVHALLLEAAQAELAAGRDAAAARLARRLVELEPREESHHELLVRSLLAAGDRDGALACVEACEAVVVGELGARASPRLRAIVREAGRADAPAVSAAAARALLEAGKAALGAGAVEAGIESLRQACAGAEGCGDAYLRARAELALGSALVHAVRAYGEAPVALHRAVELARRLGVEAIAATAHRELGFVDVQAGRHERAEAWLAQAGDEARGADEELSSVAAVRGMSLSDTARYAEALERLEESMERARRCEHRRQVAWSLALVGRMHVLTGRLAEARSVLERSLELVEEEKWIAYAPWPEALAAEIDVREGRVEDAREALEHAHAMACRLGDPCWEATTLRGLGLVEAACGRTAESLRWLADARARSDRVAYPYQWIRGWVLEALCSTGSADARAARWLDELEALAARTGMRELLLRAYQHRARLGDVRARSAASLLLPEVDNPTLRPGETPPSRDPRRPRA